MNYCIGLTGGIGSGKSTVAAIFSDLGVPVIDTDEISRQLTQPGGAAISAITTTFGKEYIAANGALDRSKMRELVFFEAAARQRLEKILHPLILTQAKSQALSNPAPYVLIVVPLLFESSNYLDWLDHTVTVDCSEEAQLERATQREGLSEQAVRAIISQQLSRSQRAERADDVIKNDDSLSALGEQITTLHRRYTSLAQSSN